MKNRRAILRGAIGLFAFFLTSPAFANPDNTVAVVATFSILGDMVKRIGGDHASVITLVGRNGDTHVYQPTPADARAVKSANVLFVNGLEFEGWIDRLVKASGFSGTRVVATNGIEAIPFEEGDGHGDHKKDNHGHERKHGHADGHKDHDDDKHGHGDHKKDNHGHERKHGHADGHKDHDDDKHGHDDHKKDNHGHERKHGHADGHKDHHDDKHGHDDHKKDENGHHHGAFDPHAWQSLKHAVTYVDNITAALAKAVPAKAAEFYENRETYVAEIRALHDEIRVMMAKLPENKRTVVTSHDAFQYFGQEYGLTFLAPQGLGTESEASANDVARLIQQMRKQRISAVFVENITDPRLLKQIANETDAKVGGMLYPGALSGIDGPASTYLDMMRHNASTLSKALGS